MVICGYGDMMEQKGKAKGIRKSGYQWAEDQIARSSGFFFYVIF
jgi:hypothetical protein